MAKKKKSKFKIRYILILILIYFIYKIFIVSLPVDKARVSYSSEVAEIRKSQIGKIIKNIGFDDLKKLKKSIESLPWVESVKLHRNILNMLRVEVTPRIPVARVVGVGGKVIDKEGHIYDSETCDSLPMIDIAKEVKEDEIATAVRIFDIVTLFEIDKMEISSGGLRTKCSGVEVLWGTGDFERKYEIMKRILRSYKNEFKGKHDFRFKNMVVLRR